MTPGATCYDSSDCAPSEYCEFSLGDDDAGGVGLLGRPFDHVEVFASVDNLFDRQYGTWGILSDPTGINGPGIPADTVTNGPGVDNRFLSPGAPREVFAGVRIIL